MVEALREALNKLAREVKRKAHGAQEPEHMGYIEVDPTVKTESARV